MNKREMSGPGWQVRGITGMRVSSRRRARCVPCRSFCRLLGVVLLPVAIIVASGCESSSSSSAVEAEIHLDFSGAYTGRDIVPNRSRPGDNHTVAPVTRLMLLAVDESLALTDNNGSQYRGRIGEIEFDATSLRTVHAGEVLAHVAIEFAGYDEAAEKTVEFAGTLQAIALTDIRGSTRNDPDSRSSGGSRAQYVYTLGAGNTLYELRGTWSEMGGRVIEAHATAPARNGEILIHSRVRDKQEDEEAGDEEEQEY